MPQSKRNNYISLGALAFVCLFVLIFILVNNIGLRIGISTDVQTYSPLVLCMLIVMCNMRRIVCIESLIILAGLATILICYNAGIAEGSIQVIIRLIVPAAVLLVVGNINISSDLIQRCIIRLFLANSIVAIGEMLFHTHLIGWMESTYNDGKFVSFDTSESFRSVAFLGGPISNATITMLINIFVLFSNVRHKFRYFILGTMALICYNSRVPFAINAFAFAMYVLIGLSTMKRRQRIAYMGTLFMLPVIYLALVATGIGGGRLFLTDRTDGGSIDVRLKIIEWFQEIDLSKLIWGQGKDTISWAMAQAGVSIIENCWILYTLQYGLVFVCVFTLLYVILAKKSLSNWGWQHIAVLTLCYITQITATNSIYSSTDSLLMFLLCALAFRPPPKIIRTD